MLTRTLVLEGLTSALLVGMIRTLLVGLTRALLVGLIRLVDSLLLMAVKAVQADPPLLQAYPLLFCSGQTLLYHTLFCNSVHLGI